MAPLELFPFRFRDPVSGKWQRARYVATLADITRRYHEWEIIGAPEIRGDEPAKMFTPHGPRLKVRPADVAPELATTIDAAERFLVAVFLRRYVTYCVRRRRFDAANEAAHLFRKIAATARCVTPRVAGNEGPR